MPFPPRSGPVTTECGRWFDAAECRSRWMPDAPPFRTALYHTKSGLWVIWGSEGYVKHEKAEIVTAEQACRWLIRHRHPVPADLAEAKAALEI